VSWTEYCLLDTYRECSKTLCTVESCAFRKAAEQEDALDGRGLYHVQLQELRMMEKRYAARRVLIGPIEQREKAEDDRRGYTLVRYDDNSSVVSPLIGTEEQKIEARIKTMTEQELDTIIEGDKQDGSKIQ